LIQDTFRGVVTGALSRVADTSAELVFLDLTDADDGSFDTTERVTPAKGFFTRLNAEQIQRLQAGGVTINSGAHFSLPYELNETPNEIRVAGQRFAIVDASIAAGSSVFMLDRKPLGVASAESEATA